MVYQNNAPLRKLKRGKEGGKLVTQPPPLSTSRLSCHQDSSMKYTSSADISDEREKKENKPYIRTAQPGFTAIRSRRDRPKPASDGLLIG